MVVCSRQLRRDMLEATLRKLLAMMMIHQQVPAMIKTPAAVRLIITRWPPSAFRTTTRILARHSWTRILPQCVHVQSVQHSLEVTSTRFHPRRQFMHAQMRITRNINATTHSASHAIRNKIWSNPTVELDLDDAMLTLHLIMSRTSSD